RLCVVWLSKERSPMKRIFVADMTGVAKPRPGRWLILAGGIAFQLVLVATLLLLGQPGKADLTLAMVNGDPSVCRVVDVALLSDAQLRGVVPGMLVRPLQSPPDGSRPGSNPPDDNRSGSNPSGDARFWQFGPPPGPGRVENCRVPSAGAV